MNRVRVTDNTSIDANQLSSILDLVKTVSNKTLDKLEKDGIFVFPNTLKESQDLNNNQFVIRNINDKFKTYNIMGFIGNDNEQLIIESRFCKSDTNKEAHSADYFLNYLLHKVLGIYNLVNLNTSSNDDNNLFDFFVFLFPYLLEQAVRKGLFKTYKKTLYNDSNVKGTIDIARHIAKNTPFVGKIAYSQREFSYDNYLMELIRHTIEHIKRLPNGHKILSKSKETIKSIIDITQNYELFDRQKIIDLNKKNIVRHAFYKEYRALQEICLIILQYKKNQVGLGNNRTYGILFDGAWLWEEYLNLLIKDLFYHPQNKANNDPQHFFNNEIGLIYPDFISKNVSNRVIADAKYKPIDNINGYDYKQMLAYMFRFEAKLGIFLYPNNSQNEDKERVLQLRSASSFDKIQSQNKDRNIFVIKQGFNIPNMENIESYDGFVKAMKDSEQKFVDTIYNLLEIVVNEPILVSDLYSPCEFNAKGSK